MTSVTRRGFLWQTSAAGVAAMGILAVAPGVMTRRGSPALASAPVAPATTTQPFVAYVRDAVAGEIAIQMGEREVIIRDAALVARLLKAVR